MIKKNVVTPTLFLLMLMSLCGCTAGLAMQGLSSGATELMCATEEDLDQEAFYGPTGRSYWVGPVGAHHLEPHAKDKVVAKRLWDLSEKETGIKWSF